MSTAHIMLGGNIGDVRTTFRQAQQFLAENHLEITAVSRVGSSAAVDCVPGTPEFCDQALVCRWDGTPEELLDLLQKTERKFGRPENHRSDESRTLDCDLIFFDSLIISTSHLTLPHPRMHQRLFVLELMVETAPDFIHPVLKKSVRQLFEEIVCK
jgi:2-amino-4-hydroxy-6-hydroxymethyldihydropteridine diphosphokinase